MMEQKPGWYCGLIGRRHLPLGKLGWGPEVRFPIFSFAMPRQLWSEDFTPKLFCNVEFWLERLAKLIGL